MSRKDNMDMRKGGIKHDTGKARFDLLSPDALEGIAKVLQHGAEKYDDRNWEKGMRWGRTFASLMRHLWDWWRGRDKDADSGLPTLDHAACCLHFLQHYEKNKGKYAKEDDRPCQSIGERMKEATSAVRGFDSVAFVKAEHPKPATTEAAETTGETMAYD